jgi:nitroimidazol reductase NimA-like FMN-containing flavoprotein (pyridoxamine 5'-phosphate oxidase superfamily)
MTDSHDEDGQPAAGPDDAHHPDGSANESSAQPASERVRLRRKRERGRHDRATIDAILDEALLSHLGIAEADGQPLVLPMLHARRGDIVYLHGSAGGRTLRALRSGAPACLTVSLLDGLVLARAAMHHSANYRSVVLLGRARAVDDPDEQRLACREIVEHVVPGRWEDVRPPSENELKATAIVAMPIDQASAKIRSGPPLDDEADRDLPAWAGVIPLGMRAGTPAPDPALGTRVPVPAYARDYRRGASRWPRT